MKISLFKIFVCYFIDLRMILVTLVEFGSKEKKLPFAGNATELMVH